MKRTPRDIAADLRWAVANLVKAATQKSRAERAFLDADARVADLIVEVDDLGGEHPGADGNDGDGHPDGKKKGKP